MSIVDAHEIRLPVPQVLEGQQQLSTARSQLQEMKDACAENLEAEKRAEQIAAQSRHDFDDTKTYNEARGITSLCSDTEKFMHA